MFWLWAALIVAVVLGFVAIVFGYVRLPARIGDGAVAAPRWPIYAGGAAVVLLAAGLFGWMARPDAPAAILPLPDPAADAPPAGQAAEAEAAEVASLAGQLEARLAETPDDPKGWQMLGWTRFQMGQFAEAAKAYRRAATLAPDDGETASALGEAMVMAGDGTITPDARAQFERALTLLPGDPRARYYLAAAKDQAGNTAAAIDDWIAIIRESPADAPVTIELRNLVSQKAKEAGIDLAGRLDAPRPASGAPPAAAAAVPAPGPSAAQVAEAQAMAPADQQAMIRGMVDRLDARLAENPADAAGWQRLIRARMVLGERERAAQALKRAEAALAKDPAGLAAVRADARAAGLSGG